MLATVAVNLAVTMELAMKIMMDITAIVLLDGRDKIAQKVNVKICSNHCVKYVPVKCKYVSAITRGLFQVQKLV